MADDSLLIREAARQMLGATPGIDLVAICADGTELARTVEQHRPDVVVTDVRMPPGGDDEGVRFAIDARRIDPHMGVVLLTQYAEPSLGAALFEGGANGRAYLLKERIGDRAELRAAIEVVAGGGTVIDPAIVQQLLATPRSRRSDPLDELTSRELEILAEMAEGKSNAAIAQSLVLTKHAVEKHIGSIFQKLELGDEQDVSRRVAAVLVYLSKD
ncbi:MAG: response regulator transcription factor [Candidatus Limnocylindrales bacterium]